MAVREDLENFQNRIVEFILCNVPPDVTGREIARILENIKIVMNESVV